MSCIQQHDPYQEPQMATVYTRFPSKWIPSFARLREGSLNWTRPDSIEPLLLDSHSLHLCLITKFQLFTSTLERYRAWIEFKSTNGSKISRGTNSKGMQERGAGTYHWRRKPIRKGRCTSRSRSFPGERRRWGRQGGVGESRKPWSPSPNPSSSSKPPLVPALVLLPILAPLLLPRETITCRSVASICAIRILWAFFLRPTRPHLRLLDPSRFLLLSAHWA